MMTSLGSSATFRRKQVSNYIVAKCLLLTRDAVCDHDNDNWLVGAFVLDKWNIFVEET